MRARLDAIAAGVDEVVEVRGLGPMLALELTPALVPATIAAARERGLLLLSCGLHGEVIRLLPPVTISDEDLADGLDALEAALHDAAA
jgi:4-aminobutyrate aminotransferase / (S)-3-amino-2-methylpropionate transaminase / 5-aminovalerate transaminase